ncbi:MAG: hypothetical protein WCJ94_04685, partial [bacterium]
TATMTKTNTLGPTFTITKTATITRTATITPISTATLTPTITPTPNAWYVDVSQLIAFPNPTKGDKVTFNYYIKGLAEKLTINVYTFGERKIYSVVKGNVPQGQHSEVWYPPMDLANGLYYFTIEGTNGTRPISRHVSAFIVQKNYSKALH